MPGCRSASNIRHLTDVSHCKLHQHLCCNREIKCLGRLRSPPRGWPGRVRSTLLDRLARLGKEADEHHGADTPDHAGPTNTTDRPERPGCAAEAPAPDRAAEAARHA